MIEEKITSLKEELKSVLNKETEIENSLLGVKELKLKYIGAIEVLTQLNEESDKSKPVKEKK